MAFHSKTLRGYGGMIHWANRFMLFADELSFRRVLLPVLGAALLTQTCPLSAATFTVTSTSNGGAGTLRNANYSAGADLINFAIGGGGPFTINLTSVLPTIIEPVTIDGTTQSGYVGTPRIELNGTSAGTDATGIYLQSSNSVVKGLAINRFTKEAIRIEGSGGNAIQGNFIGTGHYGTNSLGNGTGSSGFGGITILSPGNLIGGTDATNRNVISGSNLHGIFILNSTANGNQIVGNYIGVDVTGTKRLGNVVNGISTSGARNTLIGGTNTAARNVISGNYQSGIYLLSTVALGVNSISNVIQGNFIGTDVNGTAAISNSFDGITLEGAICTMIGGTNAGARNVISGNGGRGVNVDAHGASSNIIQGNFIGTDGTGLVRLGNYYSGVDILNSSNNIVGGAGTGAGNVISANGLSGLSLSGITSLGNVIQGNFIGTDVTGTNALGNIRSGVYATNVTRNLIGGDVVGARNLISGNPENGIWFDTNTRSNQIQGNFIGTDITGARRLGNGLAGVRLLDAFSNVVGGTSTGAGNLISGNTNSGVYLLGLLSSNNIVRGNSIGTTSNGMATLGNAYTGITIANGPRNYIGGTLVESRNLVSGNSLMGIYVEGVGSMGNVIQGNYIGSDLTGATAVPNGASLGPQGTAVAGGIDIAGAPANLIGGADAGAANLISGNWRDAICIGDAAATNNLIQGNLVGTKADGVSSLGNETHGINIRAPGGANNNVIGGASPTAANVIAYTRSAASGYDGIRLRDGNVGNVVRGNSMLGNGLSATALGIDLGANGVAVNDEAACDSDTGANQLQNFPALTNAVSAGSVTRIQGLLKSAASSTFLLQFYANTTKAVSGYGEGQTYLGSTNVTTDGSCGVNFSVVLPVGVTAGQFISATATDANNNTSEFGTNVTVYAAQTPTISVQPQNQSVPLGSNVTFSVAAAGTAPLSYQWQFQSTNLAGATSSSLVLSNVQPANAGTYQVAVSNPFGSTNSTTASLTVQFTAPALSVQVGGSGQVIISWPTNGPAYELQQATNLTPPTVWTEVTNVPGVANSQHVVTLTPTAGNRFYRLVLQ